ncbi:glycosyltransferase family 4 protein [Agrobacterium tumefaciens]|nr:glycosyltransferase family 4 protein [Agrobacterium tumefaciens]NTE18928.1 glycosyltransferase family 4 protein [Agrobacterium tumefaciens]
MIIKKICLITPGHISSNPRLVKEAIALHHAGWSIHIIFTQYMDYLVYEDTKILKAHPEWTYDHLLWTPTHKTLRLKSAIVQRLAKLISPILRISNLLINRNYHWQLKTAIKSRADLYIAHNLGTLPVAINASKKNKAKCGFDAEDFHRNEGSNDPNNEDVKLKKFIEDKYLKQADYLTAASPLICEAYKNFYPDLNPTLINNVFEIKNQPKININDNKNLKLFWFSQTIGKKRGLEDVIEALNLINNPLIELHLLGSLSTENTIYFNQLAHFEIKYYHPISSDKIIELAATFDLGLALEQNIPLNRDICLTNKIFTYLISGLAIIASDTQAQKEFMNSNTLIGELYSIGDVTALAGIITKLFNDRELLNNYRKNAYQLAQSKYNWEIEQQKFLAIIKSLIS